MREETLPLDTLVLDTENARMHDDRNVQVIEDSLSRFGQTSRLVVQEETRKVLAGNGRLVAMRRLGWTEAACILVDWNEAQSIAYALVDNRSSELASWDLEKLSGLLASLRDEEDEELTVLGWNEGEANNLLDADWSPRPVEPGGLDAPPVHHSLTFSEDQWEIVRDFLDRFGSGEDGDGIKPAEAVTEACRRWE